MARFEIRSFIGGASDYEDKGIKGAFKPGSLALDIRKKVDSLSCQQALIDEGEGVIVDLILWQVPCSDGNTYGFGDTGKIYKRTSAGDYDEVYDQEEKIIGAWEWSTKVGENPQKTFLFWADVNQELHRKEIPGTGNEPWDDVDAGEDWPKSNLEDVAWHTMRVAGGALMIANGQFVAMVGYDDSYTVEALRLWPDDLAKTIIERNDYVIVGSIKNNDSEKGTFYSWQVEAMNYINRKEIPAKGINAILDTEVPLMQAGSKGGIFYSDFVSFLPIIDFPGGGQVNPDGVDVDEGLALFGVFGGVDIDGYTTNGIYTLGRKKKNAPFVLNLDYPLPCDEIGSVKNIGTDILVSYKSGSTYGVKRVDLNNKATAIYRSLDLIAPTTFAEPPVWEAIKVPTKEMPEDTAIEVWYRINKRGEFVQAKMEGEVGQFTSGNEAIFQINSEGRIFEFLVKLIPHENESPEVYPPIEVFFN